MESIGDLFGRMRTALPKGKVLNERAELIAYFSKQLEREARVVAVRLGHYSLSDLYALQSAFKDRLNRNGKETARKYWWAITRTGTV